MDASDAAIDALHALRAALNTTEGWLRVGIKRANEIERLRGQGYDWRQVLATEDRPLMSEIINRHLALLSEMTDRFRREEVRSLYREGVKRDEIADLFGVTPEHLDAMIGDVQPP